MEHDDTRATRSPLRVPRRLDKLVASGRLSEEEAKRLRSGEPDAVEKTAVGIRVRHARARLEVAVAAGDLDRAQADALMDRLRAGEHSPQLRAQLNRLVGSGSGVAEPAVQTKETDGGPA